MRAALAGFAAVLFWGLCPDTLVAEELVKPAGPLTATGIQQLCNSVSDQLLSDRGADFARDHEAEGRLPPGGQGMYLFEIILTSAAGVTADDTPEEAKTKLQRFWVDNRTNLGCSQLGFSIHNGNVAKLAFERGSGVVIANFLRRWDLDMNFVDPADGKTLLDYVEVQLAEARGGPVETTLQRNFDLLVRSGAKRANEL